MRSLQCGCLSTPRTRASSHINYIGTPSPELNVDAIKIRTRWSSLGATPFGRHAETLRRLYRDCVDRTAAERRCPGRRQRRRSGARRLPEMDWSYELLICVSSGTHALVDSPVEGEPYGIPRRLGGVGFESSLALPVADRHTGVDVGGNHVRHSYEDARPSHLPRVDRSMVLADGRRLQVAEWGPQDGSPVVFFHGSPGSRLLCPDLAATERAGVRYISFDRPGYGRSDPLPVQISEAAVVSDLVEVLDGLAIERAALVGWSGGGQYVQAAGALVPDRLTSIAVVCALSEQDSEDDVSPEVFDIMRRVRADPIGTIDRVCERCQWLADDPHGLLRLTEQFSPSVLAAPGMRDAFRAWMQEAAVISTQGYVDEWIARSFPWGFDLADISVPTFSWFGEQDRLVDRRHADLQATRIPRCQSFGCPDCGHFVHVAHWPEILEQLT